MKQIVQHMDSGTTRIVEAPSPAVGKGSLLIHTTTSLISAGTERMLVGFGQSSLISKARQQPDRVKQVLGKMKVDGVMATVDAVRSKLGQPIPLGYCNVGTVIDVGTDVTGFKIGDRVVSNGPHADIVRVPQNLCAKIPDAVSDESAAFTVVASIGLQGIRLIQPTLGEAFAVTGVGLIGLLTVQLLRAHGCRVLAIDFDDDKLAIARRLGATTCNPGKGEDVASAAASFSRGQGVDGVIITASTTSSQPVTDAAQMCRKRGRIILVGVTGLELSRADFYEKELSFQVSCSYGPGRYDPNYEENGNDYPLPFVRWTEQRNFQAILDMLDTGQIKTDELVSKVFAFEDAELAYEALTGDKSGLGYLLKYESPAEQRLVSHVAYTNSSKSIPAEPRIAMIGAGNYASRVLIPAFKNAGCQLDTIISSGGLSSAIAAEKNGFGAAGTDVSAMLERPDINCVVIATRHNSHASLAAEALIAGKSVFVEKPLALTLVEVDEVETAYANAANTGASPQLMVGFNRRFSPHIIKAKSLLSKVSEPKAIIMTVNAGAIPKDHWTQDHVSGGGRIAGEACHFIDLMRFLVDSPIAGANARCMGKAAGSFC